MEKLYMRTYICFKCGKVMNALESDREKIDFFTRWYHKFCWGRWVLVSSERIWSQMEGE